MRVTAPNSPAAATATAGMRRTAAEGFALPPAGGRPNAVGLVAGVPGLWQLQAAPDPSGQRRRRSLRRAEALLADLDALRLGLVTGTVPLLFVGRLRAARRRGAGDVARLALRGVLEVIEIRAAVEVAKLEAATSAG